MILQVTLIKLTQAIQKINKLQVNLYKTRNKIQIDRLRKMFLAMAADIRVVVIKLAERVSILRAALKILI